jgi:hypothetical protein
MENTIVQPISATEIVLSTLGNKYISGRELTLAERLMALSASAQILAGEYGPGPAEMVVTPPELPESVKGLLANYAG